MIFIVQRECQNSGVMVESKVIMGTSNPINLLRSELWQPGEIVLKSVNLNIKQSSVVSLSSFNVSLLVYIKYRDFSRPAAKLRSRMIVFIMLL